MVKCLTCGENKVIKVAENGGVDFYSCCNEHCEDYAELLVGTNGGYTNIHEMLNSYKDVIREIQDEKN